MLDNRHAARNFRPGDVESQYLQSKVSVAVFTGFAADGLPGFNVSLREGLGLRIYGCFALCRVSV